MSFSFLNKKKIINQKSRQNRFEKTNWGFWREWETIRNFWRQKNSKLWEKERLKQFWDLFNSPMILYFVCTIQSVHFHVDPTTRWKKQFPLSHSIDSIFCLFAFCSAFANPASIISWLIALIWFFLSFIFHFRVFFNFIQ